MNIIQFNKCLARLIPIAGILVLTVSWLPSVLAQSRGIAIEPVTQKTTPPINKGTYRALIIGNNDYLDSQGKWTPLKTAVSDAKAVADLLHTHYGFTDVQVLENANRRDVLIALQDLSRRVAANDNVLLYYAGHGFMDIETNRGYWVPVDAIGTDHTTFLRNSTIRDEMSVIASRTKHTLLVSDSCFSGTLLRRGTRGLPPENNSDLYYQKVANKKSVQIIAAGGMEYVDDSYQDSGHSPFTYFLLNELKHNDKLLLTATELSTNVEKAVANNVDQVPESGVLQGAGDEMGEFIFIRVDVHVQGVPADKVKVKVNVIPEEHSDTVSPEPVAPQPQKNAPESGEKRYIMPVPTL
ncbi:caspase family protein [Kaarinaea lacus]